LSFAGEAGEHKDYLGLHCTIRLCGDATAARCPSLTEALNAVIVTLSAGPLTLCEEGLHVKNWG